MTDAEKIQKLEDEKVEHMRLLRQASEEIKSLRGQIGHLHPKAEAYDAMIIILGQFPRQRRGGSEDIAWKIDRLFELHRVEI